jgi:hypothetical protein
MTDIKRFRFLDLPKELRLLTYESIAAKKTHHRVKPGKHDQHHNLRYIRTTLLGIEILRTCRQVHGEAIEIIRGRLESIKNSPVRIISTNHIHGLPDFDVFTMFDRLDATCLKCGKVRALPVTPTAELAFCPCGCSYGPPQQNTHIQSVSIAFRRTDSGWPSPLHSCIYQFQSTFRALDKTGHYREKRRLNVEIRPALLSTVTQIVARKMGEPYYIAHGSMVRTGVNIGEDEWVRDWEEGEY